MAASFPGAVRPLSSRVDLRDTVIAADVNALQEEVVAIETTIGTASNSNKPLASTWTGTFAQTTSWTTISDRLANIETALVNGVGAGSIYAPKASPTFTGTVTTPLSVAGYVTTTSGGILNSVATIPNAGLTNSSITINGSSVSLGGSVSITGLPTQTSNSGKYLTTDGTTASWATINTLPTQTGNSGKYLTTDGSTASWDTITVQDTGFNGFLLAGM